jgi:protease-4
MAPPISGVHEMPKRLGLRRRGARAGAGSRARWLMTLAGLLAGARHTAQAQTATPSPATADYAFGPTRGVFIPGRALAGEADATALELNPGQLALLGDSSLVVVGDDSGRGAALPGRGAALLFGSPLFFHSYWGIGLQGVGGTTAPAAEGHTKFQLAYALRLGRSFGLGLGWGHIFGSSAGGTDTFDAGAGWRLMRQAALGVVVQDFGRPRPDQFTASLPRTWSGELAIRPFATDRLEIAGAAVHVEGDGWRRVAPRLRAIGRVTGGLHLFAELETLPAGAALAFAGQADYRGTLGLWADFDHLSGAVATRIAHPGGGDSRWGGSVVLRLDGERALPALERQHIERVNLAGIESDRDFLGLMMRLRALADDDGVAGLELKIDELQLGFGRIEELRDLIAELRQRGKKAFAYSVSASTREYYLASACDGIVVHPAGSVTLNGVSQNVTFYKRAMDHLGVDVQLVRIAEFKGAMEPFIVDQQSEPVKQNRNQLLDDVYDRLIAAVVLDRRRAGGVAAAALTPARLRALIDRGLYTPAEAETLGLIDAIKDETEVAVYLGQAMGRPGIEVRDPDPSPVHPASWNRPRVAVVLVDGTIVDGVSQQLPLQMGAFAGAETVVAALEECRRDPSIRAVVLRVNSPGGSALASDVIARAIVQVHRIKKPVIVSMGDYAASGGYYIAAPADLIFAEPSTITGSIGIFGYKVDVQKLVAEVGVSVETYRRGAHADFMSPYRPWSDEEVALMTEQLRHFYGMFLAVVAEGRKSRGVTTARADELGRGHVWTGGQAAGLGLVDQRGGLGAAIDYAAALAHIAPGGGELPELAVLPHPPPGTLQKLIGIASDADQETRAAGEAPSSTPLELGARWLAAPGARAGLRLLAPLMVGAGSGIEARLPFDLEIR